MNNNIKLAEMANDADYSAMSYRDLITLNFVFHLALSEIKPLINIKREEEMAAYTHEYAVRMKNYCATKAEVITCLDKEAFNEISFFSKTPQVVDEQTSDVVFEDDEKKSSEPSELPLLLPAPADEEVNAHDSKDDSQKNESIQDDSIVSSSEDNTQALSPEHQDGEKNLSETVSAEIAVAYETHEPKSTGKKTPKKKEQILVDDALEISRTMPTPNDIDVHAPYYIEHIVSLKKNGTVDSCRARRRNNLSIKDFEVFRAAAEKYENLFQKHKVLASTDDYLVTYDGEKTVFVKSYHLPEESEIREDVIGKCSVTTREDLKDMKRSNALMTRAIKKAKELSVLGEAEADVPFFDRYIFNHHGCNRLDLQGDRERFYEDVATLKEIIPSFETYARLCDNDNQYMVLNKDNCIAAMSSGHVFVVVCNIPNQEEKRKALKKAAPATKVAPVTDEAQAVSDSTVQTVEDLIHKAVDMTRTLPVANGLDTSNPYYLQSSFSVANDGNLIYCGKPFSSNVSADDLDRCRNNHKKYASTMKASKIISTDEYTAFISNDGKTITVFDYNMNPKKNAS